MIPGAARRLVLTGPESTGKSSLAAHLGGKLGVPVADEYARIYLEEHGPSYDYDLLLTLCRGHLAHQRDRVPAEAALGILDTDLINYKIWCEVVFGRCHPEILEAMERETGHVYLLCYTDLPWEPDPLREHPHALKMLFERHLSEIQRLGRAYQVVTGIGPERYRCAEDAAAKLLGSEPGRFSSQALHAEGG